jgi:hypothetical protein
MLCRQAKRHIISNLGLRILCFIWRMSKNFADKKKSPPPCSADDIQRRAARQAVRSRAHYNPARNLFYCASHALLKYCETLALSHGISFFVTSGSCDL